jgi:Beta-galactosidase trimerisation domain
VLVGALALILGNAGCALTAARIAGTRDEAGIERMAFRARQFRGRTPVLPLPDGSIVAEAEEFEPVTGAWRARDWGENYYAATMGDTFLSRKAFLGAPAQCERSEATITVQVPRAGRYLALVRYEAVHHFETRFGLRIEQNGQGKLERLYGARQNLKVWPFEQRVREEGARGVDNIVWEGHDVAVDLQAGLATITLIADRQPEPAARRNVDLVMLTTDHEQVKTRIEKEGYLPLDGMLTQAGDVYLKVHNAGAAAVTVTVGPGAEHSPYYVHLRHWKPLTIETAAGRSSDWTEVGSLLDALNDGQWRISAVFAKPETAPGYRLEFGVRTAEGAIESVRTFEARAGDLWLAYDANTRYSRRVRTADVVLYDLLDYLRAHPVPGAPPRRTIVYAFTFEPRAAADRYNAAIDEFVELMGITVTTRTASNPALAGPSGHIDLRNELGAGLDRALDALKAGGRADEIRTVSLGDEIDLKTPPPGDHEGFRAWAKAQGLAPSDVVAGAGQDWSSVRYDGDPGLARSDPRAYYYARLYAFAYGIQDLKSHTDKIKRALPGADTGANFLSAPAYLGAAHKHITTFRRGGLTMPWGEDYTWLFLPGTPQVSFLQMDLFRAGIRYDPRRAIHFYVMPHWPGNTVKSWRRMWYGALGHGMKIANLFDFRPVQAAPTENYVSLPAMYREVRRALYELASFEDIVQDGRIRGGDAALWYSETGDAWEDHADPWGASKRLLYVGITHQQLSLDVVDEEDALRGTLDAYRVLYLADAHVSTAASRAIADWVRRGGHLFASARAGMFDQFDRPNETLRDLLGVEPNGFETPADSLVVLDKRNLPRARVFDTVTWQGPAGPVSIPVVGARGRFSARGSRVTGTFADGSPAVSVRDVGRGTATYAGFLPGLSYFKPAIPLRPEDLGTTDDAMAHFIPTRFDPGAQALIGSPARGVPRDVERSNHLVQATVIESPHGLVIPLVNWSGAPVKGLRLTLAAADLRSGKVSLASGGKVELLAPRRGTEGKTVLRLDLDVADALIVR